MGEYTKLNMTGRLKANANSKLLAFFVVRLDKPDFIPTIHPEDVPFDDHPFFSTGRWHSLLTWCNQGKGYRSSVECRGKDFYFTIGSYFKNYEQEWEKFLCWICFFLEVQPDDELGEIEQDFQFGLTVPITGKLIIELREAPDDETRLKIIDDLKEEIRKENVRKGRYEY